MSRGLTLYTVMALAILAPHMLWQRSILAFRRLLDAKDLQGSQHKYTTHSHLLLFRKLKCPHHRKRHQQDPEFKENVDHGCNKEIEIDIFAVSNDVLCNG